MIRLAFRCPAPGRGHELVLLSTGARYPRRAGSTMADRAPDVREFHR